MKTINERYIKFGSNSPRYTYPGDLELGNDITVTVGTHPYIFNVVKEEHFTNQNGTINVVYQLKSTLE